MTRDEHLAWCKSRAREYLDLGDPASAIASLISDLGKHPETGSIPITTLQLAMFAAHDVEAARGFIDAYPYVGPPVEPQTPRAVTAFQGGLNAARRDKARKVE